MTTHAEMRAARAKRAEAMLALFRAGQTLTEIGAAWGITRQAVEQTLRTHPGYRADGGGRAVRARERRARQRERKDARCLKSRGCTQEQYMGLVLMGNEMIAAGAGWCRTPTGAFHSQRNNARRRGVGWELTLWQWWTIWQQSGHWPDRGRGQGYVMARHGDVGPYAVGNVSIVPATVNSSERPNKTSCLPTGVFRSKRGKPYRARRMVNGDKLYLGAFDTPAQAHAAYLMAAPPPRARARTREGRAA